MTRATSIVAAVLSVASTTAASTVTINPTIKYQSYDGTGISEAFQRSLVLHQLNNASAAYALDLLFTEKGAGFTILRNGIGSSPTDGFDLMKSIAVNKPASNSSATDYIPLPRDDEYQVWLSKQALARGVHTIYADAWSADGYMKTNNTDTYGGYLCGVTNATCASGDWRQAYADKLVKYLQDYQAEGINIDYLEPYNEPDLVTPYASMLSDGQQSADFLEILYPTLKAAGLKTKIACCDNTGWETTRTEIAGLQAAGAEQYYDLVTSHGYTSAPGSPLETDKRVWITEWSTFDAINYDWYNSSTGSFTQSFGLTWANHIQSAFSVSNVTGFVYWWGAANATDNESLIFVNGTNDVKATKRLYAHSHFGKQFVRAGATRIDASVSSDASNTLNATAFANTDGSIAVQIINNSNSTQSVTLSGVQTKGTVSTYLTNEQYDLHQGRAKVNKKGATASIPAWSLLSFIIGECN